MSGQVKINYSNSYNAQGVTPQPAIDRARGGVIHIKITLPEERIRVSGGPGAVTIPKKECNIMIDLEDMPLVNVSGYEVDREQISPERMSYPYGKDKDDGEENIWAGTFEQA